MRRFVASVLLSSVIGTAAAGAAECPPDALGVSRTIAVDPTEHARLGSFQYAESLPLEDREVVLTFDDGPLPPYTSHVLDTLASQCVKATFFMVGRMARGYPALVRRVHSEGHTIATHSQNHPFTFHRMPVEQAAREIEDGFESVRNALGDPHAVAPFFRFPGLLRQNAVEQYLADHDYMTWSVDFLADDWTHIKSQEVVRRAISRVEARGRGILLLHDIQPATALALPEILRELKARGFRIVHVVPASAEQPKTATESQQWVVRRTTPDQKLWPHTIVVGEEVPDPVLSAPNPASFGIETFGGRSQLALAYTIERLPVTDRGPAAESWPQHVAHAPTGEDDVLPIPAADNFRYLRLFRSAKSPHQKLSAKSQPRGSISPGGNKKKQAAADPIAALLGGTRGKPIGHQLSVGPPTNLNAPIQR